METITREEFNDAIKRIHERVDKMAETGTRIETSANLMQKAVDRICDCVYGNGKEGLMQKVTRLFERNSLHTKLIILMVTSIIGLSFWILQKHISGHMQSEVLYEERYK